MAKLSLVVKNKEETKTAKVEGLSDKEIISLIREFIGNSTNVAAMIDRDDSITMITPLKYSAKPILKDSYKPESNIALNAEEIPIKQTAPEPRRSKRLPLVGSETRSSFSIEDSAKTSLENTKLTDDGLRLFRTYSKCPNCETVHTGRYVNQEQSYLKCYECRDKIAVRPATKETQIFEGKEIPKLSVDGYYFTAKWHYIEPALV